MVKKRNLRGVLYSAVTSLLLLSASVAHAGVIVDVYSCQARILDPNSQYFDSNGDSFINRSSYCTNANVSLPLSGTISELVIETLPSPNSILNTVARAGYVARGDNGNLGLRVDSAAATPSTNPYYIVSEASVYVSLTVNDRITVTSTTLAPGESATIDVSGYLEGRALGNIRGNNIDDGILVRSLSFIQAGFQIHEELPLGNSIGARSSFYSCFGLFGLYGFSDPNDFSHCNGEGGDFFDAYSQMLVVQVGSTLVISSFLSGESYSSVVSSASPSRALEGWSEAEALNTFSTYLTPVTAGVQLLAESGYDYSRVPTAVPEPGTLLLLGLGCFVLMFIRRTTSS